MAHAQGREIEYPVKAKKQTKPSKFSNALMIKNTDGDILWLQRPDNGIWGGLWSLPLEFVEKVTGKITNKKPLTITTISSKQSLEVCSNEKIYEAEFTTAEQIINEWLAKNKLTATAINGDLLGDAPLPIKHSLTHFHWYLTPQILSITSKQIAELNDKLNAATITFKWLTTQQAQDSLGLPRAMEKIIENDS